MKLLLRVLLFFSVAACLHSQAVYSFTLIDTDTDVPVAGFDPVANGAAIDLLGVGANTTLSFDTSRGVQRGMLLLSMGVAARTGAASVASLRLLPIEG